MKAKYAPMTKALCQLVNQAVADASAQVIGDVKIVEDAPAEEALDEALTVKELLEERSEVLANIEESPVEEIPTEEAPAEGIGQPRFIIDLKCMESLKEAHKWCEEHEIFGT